MTEIFEKNVKAMEKWYPDFADEVRSRAEKTETENPVSEEERSEIVIEEELSWDGEQIYRIEKDGRKLYLNGKRDVADTLSNWQERIGEVHKHAPILLVGLGSGLYLKKLCSMVDDTVNILVYEPSEEIFFHTLKHVDLSECLEKQMIVWAVEGISGEGFISFFARLVTLETVRYLKTECHPNYQELFPIQVRDILKTASGHAEAVLINESTKRRFASHVVENQIRNMRYLVEGYNTWGLMNALPEGFPAILVAAGPSLNKNINELKNAKGKAFILAVDTAIKPLLKAGIVPDAFITIDGIKPLELVDMDQAKDIPIIAPSTANANLIGGQRNKKIFYDEGQVLCARVYHTAGKKMPDSDTGGSVACSGFSILQKMRFSTIILVGQDLAFTGGKSHADGTFKDVMPKKNTEKMLMVKGNYEEKVPTLTNLRKYLRWFETYIGYAKAQGELRVINATEGGAWIEGTELMTLKEAIEETCKETADFEAAIRDMQPVFSEEEKQRAIGCLIQIQEEFLMVKKEAGRLADAYRKMEKLSRSKTVDAKTYTKLLKRIKKMSKKCEEGVVGDLIQSSLPLAEYILRTESMEEWYEAEDEIKAAASQGMKYAVFIRECAQLWHDFMEEELKDAGFVS